MVYGMPYEDWKAKYQGEATAKPEAGLRKITQALKSGDSRCQVPRPPSPKASLRPLVERIERLEEEKKTIAGDIKEVYAEAKANGFDTKILRKVISLRKKEAAEREEEQSMLDLYMAALGMIPGETEEAA